MDKFFSEESEQTILSAIISNPEYYYEFNLLENDFYFTEHKELYKAIQTLCQRDQMTYKSLINLLNEKGNLDKVNGLEYLALLRTKFITKYELPFFYSKLMEKSAYRKVNEISKRLFEISNTDHASVDDLVNEFHESVSEFEIIADDTLTTIKDQLDAKIINIQERKIKRSPVTGFTKLDMWMKGLGDNRLIVIAGRPGTGKTAFSLSVLGNIAQQNFGTPIMFSMEMSSAELTDRMLSDYSGVSFSKIMQNDISPDFMPLIIKGKDNLSQLDLYIDDKAKMDINFITTRLRKLKRKHGKLGLVFIDYLGLMDIKCKKGETKTDAIGKITMGLKHLTREIGCSIVLLCQMNRDSDKIKRKPVLSDLRDSGSIEQDADMVMFLHREEEQKEDERLTKIGLYIEKGRQTGMGSFQFNFNGAIQRFTEV